MRITCKDCGGIGAVKGINQQHLCPNCHGFGFWDKPLHPTVHIGPTIVRRLLQLNPRLLRQIK